MSKKILLADDSVTIQKVVSITLAHEDFELTIVDNGTEAVVKAKEIRPDVILLDVVMPDKDGYEVCQEIKASNGLAKTPIILLTGTFEPFDEDRASEVGADDFIKKPFESHALINKIKEMAFKGGVQKPAGAAYTEVEEIDGLDDLEGIDDLGDFDDFETPTEVKMPETPVSTESITTGPEEDTFPIERDAQGGDDIWSVEEYDDISGDEESLDIEGTDELWGDENLDAESEAEAPETTVIEETRVSEESFALEEEAAAPAADLVDDDFELGGDISIDDLGSGIEKSAFDDDTGMMDDDDGGDDLFTDDIKESPISDADISMSDGGGFTDDNFDMETAPTKGVGESYDDFSMDEFEKRDVSESIELPGGEMDDFAEKEPYKEDSVELDWGDESGDVSESEDFVFNDNFGAEGVDVKSSFEPAPSETSIKGEVAGDEWSMEDMDSTPDSFGDFAGESDTISMNIDVEPEPEPEIEDVKMMGQSEEISRMVKERVIEEGIIPDAAKAGMSDVEVASAVDKIAREIVQKVVWEVVPELAEELIKDEIRRLKGEKEG